MQIQYKTKGVCSRSIQIQMKDGIIEEVSIDGGCNGNTKGLCQLVKGRSAQEIISLLRGVECGTKKTSCPDQLACALEQALSKG